MSTPTDLQSPGEDVKETGRIEALSDGVIAIVITLLAFEIGVPDPAALGAGGLLPALIDQWPVYFAFLLSFATIAIMWSNHHALFKIIVRTNPTFVLINGLLLLTITLVPFGTLLLADYLRHPDGRVAAVIYSALFTANAAAFNVLWLYASGRGRLLSRTASPDLIAGITRQYRFGPLMYVAAMLIGLVSVPLCLIYHVALALFFAIPGFVHR